MIYKKKERKYFYGFVICYRLIITSAKKCWRTLWHINILPKINTFYWKLMDTSNNDNKQFLDIVFYFSINWTNYQR